MDFSRTKLPKPLLSYLLPFLNVQLPVKRLAGSPKGAEIDPNLPHANKSVTCSTRILIYIDGLFQSHQTVPSCYLTFFHFPERSIALVKRLAGSPKGAEIDPNLPHKQQKLPVAHAFYIH
jgi:hypothetical protein